jgi:hypothetical protein
LNYWSGFCFDLEEPLQMPNLRVCDLILGFCNLKNQAMKKISTPKIYWLLLFIIPLLTSCETLRCDSFDPFNPVLDLALFPTDIPTYEFTSTSDAGGVTLTFEKQVIEFSGSYQDNCNNANGCNCYATYRTRYFSQGLQLALGNDIAMLFEYEEPIELVTRYLSFDANNQITDGQNIDFPPFYNEIVRDVNNLTRNEIIINGELFNNAIRIDFNQENITLIVERFNGLQGILYQGELYRRND